MQITESALQAMSYELYKIDWEREYITTERKLAEYRLYTLTELEDNCNESFEDWLFDNGYGGEIYACFDEFIDCEYQDYGYMKYLLGNSVFWKAYEEYQEKGTM